LRENQNLREKFDVILMPPMGGGGPAGLSAMLRGLPMRGGPMPWKNSEDTPNFFAPGLDSTEDIRGGLGYQGLSNLEKFVRDGGLLIAVQTSASLPVAGGMTDMVNVAEARAMQAPGSVVLSSVDDKKSPITYGYDDKLYVYFRQARSSPWVDSAAVLEAVGAVVRKQAVAPHGPADAAPQAIRTSFRDVLTPHRKSR